jgi:CheY-like chemotaxis protein
MMTILIVEDEDLVATTLRGLVELNPRYTVTAIVRDAQEALDAVELRRPDLALVDLNLADSSSGYSLAAELVELDIPCLFITGNPPVDPLPELALGCLTKPFNEDELTRALQRAEDLIRGRQRLQLRARGPSNLEIYTDEDDAVDATGE